MRCGFVSAVFRSPVLLSLEIARDVRVGRGGLAPAIALFLPSPAASIGAELHYLDLRLNKSTNRSDPLEVGNERYRGLRFLPMMPGDLFE